MMSWNCFKKDSTKAVSVHRPSKGVLPMSFPDGEINESVKNAMSGKLWYKKHIVLG